MPYIMTAPKAAATPNNTPRVCNTTKVANAPANNSPPRQCFIPLIGIPICRHKSKKQKADNAGNRITVVAAQPFKRTRNMKHFSLIDNITEYKQQGPCCNFFYCTSGIRAQTAPKASQKQRIYHPLHSLRDQLDASAHIRCTGCPSDAGYDHQQEKNMTVPPNMRRQLPYICILPISIYNI